MQKVINNSTVTCLGIWIPFF